MNKIEKFLSDAYKDNVFPGCCCSIINRQNIERYCVGYKTHIKPVEKNQIDTLYDLASLTKVVGTTPMILKLIQEKYISYQTPVYKILPMFTNKNITIFHLLTHTSGLPADFDWEMNEDKKAIIQRICYYSHQVDHGKKVVYSDLGYIILGEIIEILTQQSLQQILSKKIFQPLEMFNTGFCPQEIDKCAPTEYSSHVHYVLKGEVHDHKAFMMNGVAGHAGVFSNIFDLEHYARMILNYGKYKNRTFLDEQYINDMFTNFSPMHEIPRGIGFLTYAPDSLFSSLNSVKTIAHTGFTGTSMLIDLENQVAIILLSNRVHPSRKNTKILDWRSEFHDFVMKCIIGENVDNSIKKKIAD